MTGDRRRRGEVRIEDLGHDGRGVAHVGGKAVLVRDALPGELVRFRTTRRKRHFDEAELDEVLEASPHRLEPGCPHFGNCSGCTLQHFEPGAQLAAKQDVLAGTLERLGRVEPESWLPQVTGPEWGYRRRARLSVRRVAAKGRVLVGFRERRGRRVADLDRCPVLDPAVGERLAPLAAMLETLQARDDIPQIEVACGDNATALVFRHMNPLAPGDRDRLAAFGREQGFQVWLQSGDPETALCLDPDAPPLEYGLAGHGVALRFRPVDFLQVNAHVNRKLVDDVVRWIEPGPGETVLDLFCGLGNFTLPLARHAGRVVGVEGDANLVQRGRDNALRNELTNATFHAADLSVAPVEAPWLVPFPDKVLLDPPRTGARVVLNRFAGARPGRVVYVSCHPGTLARDAGFLVNELGYRFTACGVLDMFPHTAHVEAIAVLDAA